MISSAFAQAAPGGAGGMDLMGLLPLILMFVLLYFLLLRPQMKRAKEHRNMLGALQIHAMHKELVDSKRMANRPFHDFIFQSNRIPIEMIHAEITRQKLTRDYKPSWKFYGPIPTSP